MELIYSASLTIFKYTILMPSIRVSGEVYERLKRIAEEEGLSYSEVIRRALENSKGSMARLVEAVEEIAITLKEILRVLREVSGGMSTAAPTVRVVGNIRGDELLPSFVKDNPWLEVLRSRGKD